MPRITRTTGGRWYTKAFDGLAFAPGETKDVSEGAAEWLLERDGFEDADNADNDKTEFPILNKSVSDLEAELDDGGHDAHLAALKRGEEEFKNRSTAKEAIDERQATIETESGSE